MKIQTEITRGVFLVTCVDSRLDASVAPAFFKSMQGYIHKGYRYVGLNLSNVDFVDSAGLGALVRCIKELNSHGQLVLYGANELTLSLLQMTRLDSIFTLAKDKNEAIELLLYNKKRFAGKAADGFDVKGLDSLKMEETEIHEVASGEKRRHQRISNTQILNEDILVYCTNIRTGKHSTAIVLNISPSGLLLASPSSFTIGDEFRVEGTVGKNFKFKERLIVRSASEGKYGMEFMKPSLETTQFLHQLTGAVILGRGQINN